MKQHITQRSPGHTRPDQKSIFQTCEGLIGPGILSRKATEMDRSLMGRIVESQVELLPTEMQMVEVGIQA